MRRTGLWLLVAFVGISGAASCSTGDAEDEAFWSELRLAGGAVEAEQYDSAKAMVEAADFVAQGRFVGTKGVRLIQGDAAEDQVFLAQLVFEVGQVVNGPDSDPTIIVEFLVGSASEKEAQAVVDVLQKATPETGILLFVRHKRGAQESGLYRPINSLGLWAEREGKPNAPLSDDDSRAGQLLRSAGSPDDLGEFASWIATQPPTEDVAAPTLP